MIAMQAPKLRVAAGSAAEPSAQSPVHRAWAATPLAERLRVLRRVRHGLAGRAGELVKAIAPGPARKPADTLAAEVLPLLAACRFLEREAKGILAPRTLGRRGLPFWLSGIDATVERVPLGTVLIIAPANYPLFLPGVQALQALAAGNAVVWKPGAGGAAVADVFADACGTADLPNGLLRVTDESVQTAAVEIDRRPDKIVFTGSSTAGRAVMRMAADHAIPVVAELSGCDAVLVLEGADVARVVDALCFGMRLNGSATCMAPRRLLLVGGGHEAIPAELQRRFEAMEPVFLADPVRLRLEKLLVNAQSLGANVSGGPDGFWMKPLLVMDGLPEMEIARTDLFAPVVTVIRVRDEAAALEAEQECPFGLTAAIFGDETKARALGARLSVGTVLVNDLIVPTADPRVPFGGRRDSGFGVTRGTEGLLEMTAVKTTSVRRSRDRRHYQPTGETHADMFAGVLELTHAAGWGARWAGLRKMVAAAKKLK